MKKILIVFSAQVCTQECRKGTEIKRKKDKCGLKTERRERGSDGWQQNQAELNCQLLSPRKTGELATPLTDRQKNRRRRKKGIGGEDDRVENMKRVGESAGGGDDRRSPKANEEEDGCRKH